jgi:hypothetical protein
MLLIDAATISDGGGYGLLKLLLEGLTFYDVDPRVIARPDLVLPSVNEDRVYRRKVGLRNRKRVISDCVDDSNPSHLLCFCNFPPPAKYPGVQTTTYFHRVGLIEQHNIGLRTVLRSLKYGAMVNYLRLLFSLGGMSLFLPSVPVLLTT